ncbi:MAG TPA: TonB-dependent receptor [Alloacidobacterium sp.]|nr:TonB-dependent receptor [Alloacidobacterium sp.]
MRTRNMLVCCLLLLLCGSIAFAQTITGSVTGTVTDPSGAAVSGATVTATNTATGVSAPTQTNSAGVYTLRFLPIGQYKVTVEATGFDKSTTEPFALEVAQEARIDVKLTVGQVSQSVTVTGAAPILNTQNPTTGDTITAETATEVPLQARNFSSLSLLVAGAITTNPMAQNSIKRSAYNGGYFQNGNREQTNNYTLDGVDINESIDNYIGYSPNVDAIGEMKIITGDATAEYGNANGGQIVMVTKSGTNHFHGNAFWFLENQNLNADSWLNKHTSGTPLPVSPFNRSQFGGTFGGPIKRDKLFFFADYQGGRQHTSTTETFTVPDAAMRAGYNPSTGQTVTITNPAAKYLLAHPELYPMPNAPGNLAAGAYLASDNYVGVAKQFVQNDQGDVKVDWQVRQSDLLSGRFTMGRQTDGNSTVSMATEFPQNNSNPYTGFAINWTHTFSSNVVSEARAGYGRPRYTELPVDIAGHFGLNGNQTLGIPGTQGLPGFSTFVFSGGTKVTPIGGAGGNNDGSNGGIASDSIINTFVYGDNVSWQLGRHTLKFGGQALRYQQNRYYSGNDGALGQFGYTGNFTGDSWTDFLTDTAFSFGQGESVVNRWGQRQWRDALFIQDDWKVMPNLTLNLGMRWEWDQPLYEVNNKQANIDINTGQITYAGVNGASRALYKSFWGGFMPRVGFAFTPDGFHDRFVVRGGYAITNFMEGTGANLRLTLNPPFFIDSSEQSDGTTTYSVTNGFPRPADPTVFAGNVRAWQPNLKPALIQQFNLTTETQFGNDLSLVVAYLGQTGNHLVDPREGNQAFCSRVAIPSQPQSPCPLPLAKYPLLSQVSQVSYTESEAMMNYNALQASLRKRTSNGLEFLANYTYSKSLSNNLGYYGAGGVSSQSAYWQDAYNGGGDYGPAFFDAKHIFSFSGYYDLPFGRGKMFGGGMNRVEDMLVGGWKVGAIASLHSGFPVTISSNQFYNANQRTNRANHYRPLKIRGRSTDKWFGTDASATPCASDAENASSVCAYGAESSTGFGTARVGSERAPSFKDFDMAASKRFAITEGSNLEFRADLFNILNTVSLGPPDQSVSDSNFGQITSTNSTERQIQLALKYTF